MLLKQPVTLILATVAVTVTSARQSPDFRITLTNTTLRVTSEYTASVDEATVVVGATGTFDSAKLECLHEVFIPEFHCILHDKNSTRTVEIGPGNTGVVCALDVGLITCGWVLPDYENECRANPSGTARP